MKVIDSIFLAQHKTDEGTCLCTSKHCQISVVDFGVVRFVGLDLRQLYLGDDEVCATGCRRAFVGGEPLSPGSNATTAA